MRQKLQEKVLPDPKTPSEIPSLKFGAFNVNGLDIEAGWAVGQLLDTRNFDVSNLNNCTDCPWHFGSFIIKNISLLQPIFLSKE